MVAPLSAWPWEHLGIFKYILYGPLAAKAWYSWMYEDNILKDLWCIHILLICTLRGFIHQLWSSYNSMFFLTRNRWIKQQEPLYYWAHRLFHKPYLFNHYHSLHHSSPVPHPFTAGHATPLEHLVLCTVIGIPITGSILMGYGSTAMIYGHVLVFDFFRCLGHSNAEVVPHEVFNKLPLLRYFIYTPTYHSLHHTEMETNFSMHAPFALRSFASTPFCMRMFLLPFWPLTFMIMLVMWGWSKTFLFSFYNLRGRLHQTWVVPRFGFQYFLPFATKGINRHIEEAILRADRLGVKVISLAALNKNEALNGGGTLFVNKHPELKVRVVHGNTLTAAVILNEFSKDVKEVFLTGATSKLGRATALYLCRKRVRVLMLTSSTERFQKILKEAPVDCQNYLVQVTKYQAAQNCKTWIVGKWITPWEQSWAPSGTHFHQFVVPPILPIRRDCTYGDLAAMRLPPDVEGLGSCEYTMERGVVHACHAGGVVHQLEGWSHHEVGAIDVDRIDLVWEAALKHGLKPVSSVNN
ncbi:hypothetical protein CXB51_036838 [Gossypium anomalum]|uniref:Fatty acid hydroxylase domain-containing protein n=1 Tax=Gossypium anomalum TaxID=47600 RepID=A0A8J5XVY1_9ROSI|nr:hypothetical protein CXB51_036838 [Gossypium anomalum]